VVEIRSVTALKTDVTVVWEMMPCRIALHDVNDSECGLQRQINSHTTCESQCFLPNNHTGSEAQPTNQLNAHRWLFPHGKAVGAWDWQLTPSSADVKKVWRYTPTHLLSINYAFVSHCRKSIPPALKPTTLQKVPTV